MADDDLLTVDQLYLAERWAAAALAFARLPSDKHTQHLTERCSHAERVSASQHGCEC